MNPPIVDQYDDIERGIIREMRIAIERDDNDKANELALTLREYRENYK